MKDEHNLDYFFNNHIHKPIGVRCRILKQGMTPQKKGNVKIHLTKENLNEVSSMET